MPAVASRSATLSLAKDSRVILGSHAGARLRVNATPSATTVVVTSASELTGTALYTSGSPGMLVVLTCAAGTTHHGKTSNITAISGTSLTVPVDFSAILAAGDIILVVPPLSVELFLNQGHSLNVRNNNDYTMGLTETFDTHNTPLTVDVDGDVPGFLIPNSQGLMRILAFAIGSYKLSAGSHVFRPIQANDGTFANSEEATILVQDGNAVVRQLFYGLFATRLTITIPEGGLGTFTVSVLGAGASREIGGAGKAYTTGANNYIRANFACDTGAKLSYRAAFVELGGSFGAGLTTATETTVKTVTITIERGAISDRTLGDANIIKAEEDSFRCTVTGTRILQTNTIHANAFGAATDADPGLKVETRMLVKLISLADATKTITFDIPRGVFSSHVVNRQRGRFTEDFTFQMLATLDGTTNCVSTATPPIQVTAVSSYTSDLLLTI